MPQPRLVSRTVHLVIREVYSYPPSSSAPFPAARPVVETTAEELPESRPSIRSARPVIDLFTRRAVGQR